MDFNWKEDDYYNGIEEVESFENLSEQIQTDLTEWFNVTEPSKDDKEILLKLYLDGQFRAWDCSHCKFQRVYEGQPDNWDNFQGTLNQDFSFFGNPDKYQQEYIDSCCDHCRGFELH